MVDVDMISKILMTHCGSDIGSDLLYVQPSKEITQLNNEWYSL